MARKPGGNAAPLLDLEEVYRMHAHDLRRFALYLTRCRHSGHSL